MVSETRGKHNMEITRLSRVYEKRNLRMGVMDRIEMEHG